MSCPVDPRAAPTLAIEAGIRPVCDVLNSMPGVTTLWSCEGHVLRSVRPYVTFLATTELAFLVDRALCVGRGPGTLKYCWRLIATFRDDGVLQFTIEPNDVSFPTLHPCNPKNWPRRDLNAELQRLADVISFAFYYCANQDR